MLWVIFCLFVLFLIVVIFGGVLTIRGIIILWINKINDQIELFNIYILTFTVSLKFGSEYRFNRIIEMLFSQ